MPEDAAEDSAAGTIQFAGWLSQSDCKVRLNAADCLVLPSLFECGGAVVLEAMALGKPVIATAWGGPLDYLDADCGILVQPRLARPWSMACGSDARVGRFAGAAPPHGRAWP